MTQVRAMERRPLGFATRDAAERDVQHPENPHVSRIGLLDDGSWAVQWRSGVVTGPHGAIPASFVRWAPEPVIGIVFHASDELRRRVALAMPCARELADDGELRRWLVDAVQRELTAALLDSSAREP